MEATGEHPFWVEGKGFVLARYLARSDLLRDEDGRRVPVVRITSRTGQFTVYNFEVEPTHTYYAAGWWVHNQCPPRRIYGGRELWRAENEPGPYHNFPSIFDEEIFSRGERTEVSPRYTLYRLRGSINGQEGTYEIGVRPSPSGRTEVITHRYFQKDRRR